MPGLTGLRGIFGNQNLRQPADAVATIRAADLPAAVAKGPVVVEFFNYGCPFCRAAMPELEKVAREKLGKVKFVRIPLGEADAQALAGQYGVSMLPGFAVFHDGEFLGEFGRQGNELVGADFIKNNVSYAFDSVGVKV